MMTQLDTVVVAHGTSPNMDCLFSASHLRFCSEKIILGRTVQVAVRNRLQVVVSVLVL